MVRHNRNVRRRAERDERSGTMMPDVARLPRADMIPEASIEDFREHFAEEKTPNRIAIRQEILSRFRPELEQAGLYDDAIDAFVQIYTKALDLVDEKLQFNEMADANLRVCDDNGDLHSSSLVSEYRALSNELFNYLTDKKYAQDHPKFLSVGKSPSGHSWAEMALRGTVRESQLNASDYDRLAVQGTLRIGKTRGIESDGVTVAETVWHEPIEVDRAALKQMHEACVEIGASLVQATFDAKAAGEQITSAEHYAKLASKLKAMRAAAEEGLSLEYSEGKEIFADAVGYSFDGLNAWLAEQKDAGAPVTALQVMQRYKLCFDAEMAELDNGEDMNLIGQAFGSKEGFKLRAGAECSRLSFQVFDAVNACAEHETVRGR